MPIHDFVCEKCGKELLDEYVPSGSTGITCECGATLEPTYSNWKTLGMMNGGCSVDDRVNARDGTITSPGASHSELCKIELGLSNKTGSSSMRTFTKEQQIEFRKKALAAGNSAREDRKLFNEVMETRKENMEKLRSNSGKKP